MYTHREPRAHREKEAGPMQNRTGAPPKGESAGKNQHQNYTAWNIQNLHIWSNLNDELHQTSKQVSVNGFVTLWRSYIISVRTGNR